MNRLKTTDLGGMPFDLDDLEFEQAAVRDAFYGLISALGIDPVDSFILSGLSITDNGDGTISHTAGYICLNGEVLKVDAAVNITATGMNLYWELESTYDGAGNEEFQSGTTFDTYEVRKGKLNGYGSPDATKMPLDAPTFNDKIIAIINTDDAAETIKNKILAVIAASNLYALSALEAWHEVGAVSEPAFQNGWTNNGSGYPKLAFRKDAFGRLVIKGRPKLTSFTAGKELIFTLPVGYRPNSTQLIAVNDMLNFGSGYALQVLSNGNVQCQLGPYGNPMNLNIPEQSMTLTAI